MSRPFPFRFRPALFAACAAVAALCAHLWFGNKVKAPGLPRHFDTCLASCPRVVVADVGRGHYAVFDTENARLHAFVQTEDSPVAISGLSSTGLAQDTNRLAGRILWQEGREPAWSLSGTPVKARHLGWETDPQGRCILRHLLAAGGRSVTVRQTLENCRSDTWSRAIEIRGLAPGTTLALALPPPAEAWSVSPVSARIEGAGLLITSDGDYVLTRKLPPP